MIGLIYFIFLSNFFFPHCYFLPLKTLYDFHSVPCASIAGDFLQRITFRSYEKR